MNSHPDAETLSAFLDGEAPEAEEHVRTCAECRERLDVLARVRTAVASPRPAYDTARKNAAIAAAVDAAAATPGTTSERRSLWRLVAAVGVAAAVVGGVLAVNRVTTSHTSSTASGPVASDVVRAGNLGDINDDLALRAAVQPSLPSANKGSAGAGPFGADNGASGQVGGAAGKAGPANATPAPSVTALSTT